MRLDGSSDKHAAGTESLKWSEKRLLSQFIESEFHSLENVFKLLIIAQMIHCINIPLLNTPEMMCQEIYYTKG